MTAGIACTIQSKHPLSGILPVSVLWGLFDMRAFAILATLALSSAAGVPAQAAILIRFADVGSDVVATAQGSLDLSGMQYNGLGGIGRLAIPSFAVAYFGGTGALVSAWSGFSGSQSWGSGGDIFATSRSGDTFGLVGAETDGQLPSILVPLRYVSDTPLSSTMTFANQSIAGMRFTPGRYVYTLPNDGVVVQIGAVPEPASWAMMIAGFGLVGAAMRRRRGDAMAG